MQAPLKSRKHHFRFVHVNIISILCSDDHVNIISILCSGDHVNIIS